MRNGQRGESLSEDLERELRRLPDVSAVRVVTDQHDEPAEVHVLALPGRHAKQIVRDVESIALAGFGLEIDRRIVSIVQLEQPDPEPTIEAEQPAPPLHVARPVLDEFRSSVTGPRILVEAVLDRAADTQIRGFANGSVAAIARSRIVAAATLDALCKIDARIDALGVEHARVVRVGDHDVAVVVLSIVDEYSERMVAGAVPVVEEPDASERAVAQAVIDAVWRYREGS